MDFKKIVSYVFVISVYWTVNPSTVHGLRILGLFPMQMKSAYVMCEELMIGLAAKGHTVDVYSHFPPKKPVPNFQHFNLHGPALPALNNNLTFDSISSKSIPEFMSFWFRYLGNSMCDLLEIPLFQKLLHDPPRDPPYDLIVNEFSVANCFLAMGRHLNVPMIGVLTMPYLLEWMFDPFGAPTNLATDPPVQSPMGSPVTFLERLNNVLWYYSLKITFEFYVRDQDTQVEKYFGPGYPRSSDLFKELSLVLVNHDPALNGVRILPPMLVPVGGLHIVDRNESLPKIVENWLDKSTHGCIYFSFGSMARIETFPLSVLEVFFKSMKNLAPVRFLMKIAKPDQLPPGLPSNVLTYPWLPQIQVLKHKNVKAFLTHGGLMGTQESVYYGVPMVAVPLFSDQLSNAEIYAKKNIALKVYLKSITEEELTHALKEILENRMYREAVRKISTQFKDRLVNPLDTAIFWIEYIHQYGKDALKHPIMNIPWWQASLLDVYGFISISFALILVVSITIIRKFIDIVFPRIDRNPSLKLKKKFN